MDLDSSSVNRSLKLFILFVQNFSSWSMDENSSLRQFSTLLISQLLKERSLSLIELSSSCWWIDESSELSESSESLTLSNLLLLLSNFWSSLNILILFKLHLIFEEFDVKVGLLLFCLLELESKEAKFKSVTFYSLTMLNALWNFNSLIFKN